LPIVFFAFLSVALFYKYFLFGKVPIPGDILLGHYHPWSDLRWGGIETIYPIKNWILFDGIKQTLPWRLLAVEQMKNGQLPLWNPYILSGTPLLGNLQAAAFYPLNFLFWLLPKLDAWTMYLICQPFLAGLLMFYFLKDLVKKTIPSYLGAIGWGLSLIMLNHLEFGIDGHTALWLPLGLLAINKIQEKFQSRWGILLSLSVLMTLLGGYPPPALCNLALMAIYFLVKTRPIFSKKALLISLFFLLGVVLSAPQSWPAYQLSKKIVREKIVFGKGSNESYFLPIENLIMVFAPDFFGHPATWNFFSKIYYSDNASVGSACFIFWSLTLVFLSSKTSGKKRVKKETIFWWLIVLIPTILMVDNPFSRLLRDLPIGFLAEVAPMRMIWIAAFGLAVLAGLGMGLFDDLARGSLRKRISFFLLPTVLIFIFWTLSFFVPANQSQRLITQRNLVLPSFVAFMTMAMAILALKFKKIRKLASLAILILAAGELLRQGWKYNSYIDKELVFPETKITKYLKAQNNGYRTVITDVELFPANANIPYHIPVIGGYASIRDGRYDYLVRLMDLDASADKLIACPRIIYQPEWRTPVANLLGAKYILSLNEIDDENLNLIVVEGKTKLYENKNVFDRAFFVKNYWVEKDIQSIANRMLNINLKEEAVLEKDLADIELGLGKAVIVDYKDNYVLLETENEKEGLLVLTDAYDQNWRAYIDGQETEVLRADLDLRAVVVPKGKHKISFRYLLGIKNGVK